MEIWANLGKGFVLLIIIGFLSGLGGAYAPTMNTDKESTIVTMCTAFLCTVVGCIYSFMVW